MNVESNDDDINQDQEKIDFESKSEDVELSSQSFFTLINCKRINENLKIKRTSRRLFSIEENFVLDDNDDAVVDDFDATTIIDDNDDDSLAKSERDADEIAKNVNEDEAVRREKNADEDSSRDAARIRSVDNALDKRKR
jgi:hypothetical protein